MRSRSRLGPTPVPRDLTEASRFTFSAIYDSVRRVISVGGRGGEATGRSSEGSAAAGAGSDHRSGPSAGAAGARDRLGVSRQAVCRRVHGRSGAAAAADPAGGRAVHFEAHARFVGRGAVRALAGEPVLPILLRRIELLPRAAVRPLLADALASAVGRGGAGRASPGEPVGGAQDRRAGDP